MSKKLKLRDPMIFANRKGLADQIQQWIGDKLKGKPYCLVCVSDNAPPGNLAFGFEDMGRDARVTRALVVFEGLPIDLEVVGKWRGWAMEHGAWDLQMAFLQDVATAKSFEEVMNRSCASWFQPLPARESPGISKGRFVRMPTGTTAKDDSSLLTMMFGSMGELLAHVEVVARRFRAAVEPTAGKFSQDEISKYLSTIDNLLASEAKTTAPNPVLGVENLTDHLPKLLLRGDSGVGKTLIASYLHDKSGRKGRPLRVSIPEYLGKEDMFEYDLLGYASGNYTGGRKEGSHGLLLENVGGVVFLDEIGEANSILQAKLLTFLDDYMVRPKGWKADPFYCPVLVVAATNRDLDMMVEKKEFRGDLRARFTDRHEIPALRNRMEDLPFILDCLLQRESMNLGGLVQEIGQAALDSLKSRSFEHGNFRELEDLFREACAQAGRQGRNYLTESDFLG